MVCNVAVLVNLMIPMTCLNAQNLRTVQLSKPPALVSESILVDLILFIGILSSSAAYKVARNSFCQIFKSHGTTIPKFCSREFDESEDMLERDLEDSEFE